MSDKALRHAIEEVRSIGQQMSNVFYNLRQQDVIREQDKLTMDELYQAWDKANNKLFTVLHKKGKG